MHAQLAARMTHQGDFCASCRLCTTLPLHDSTRALGQSSSGGQLLSSPPHLEVGEVRPDRVVPGEAREEDGGVLLLAQDAVLVLEHEAHPRHASAAQIFVAACADARPLEVIGTDEAAVGCRHLSPFTKYRSRDQRLTTQSGYDGVKQTT